MFGGLLDAHLSRLLFSQMNILIGSHKILMCEFQREASGVSCLDRGNHISFMVTVSLFSKGCVVVFILPRGISGIVY